MSKAIKYGLLIIGAVIITISSLMGFGFYLMEIEDHYGDIQELFYKAENGDIIINKTNTEFGIIEKNWKRINIRSQKKDSTDLFNWIYQNNNEIKSEIYRTNKGRVQLNDITYFKLQNMIDKSELKLIIKN